MAKAPAKKSNRSPARTKSLGPKLMGVGAALFVLTRIIVWLPLGIVGSWINGLLWPVLVVSIIAGAALTYRKFNRA